MGILSYGGQKICDGTSSPNEHDIISTGAAEVSVLGPFTAKTVDTATGIYIGLYDADNNLIGYLAPEPNATGTLVFTHSGTTFKWSPVSDIETGKILVSADDQTFDYLLNKVQSSTLTISFTAVTDSTTGLTNVMLDVNVVNGASGYPNTIEPFFKSGQYDQLGTDLFSTITDSQNLTRGFTFIAPRSATINYLGIYMKGEPSPSNKLKIQLSLKRHSDATVVSTAEYIINTTNFTDLASGGLFVLPLATALAIAGGDFYTEYFALQSTDSNYMLSAFSNFQLMELCNKPAEHIQLAAGVYSQYSSQNFTGYGNTGYSDVACRPYMTLQE